MEGLHRYTLSIQSGNEWPGLGGGWGESGRVHWYTLSIQSGNNRPISVYRLGEMPIQSCGQRVSAPRGKAGARLNAHTELRAKRQRLARDYIYRNWPIGQAQPPTPLAITLAVTWRDVQPWRSAAATAATCSSRTPGEGCSFKLFAAVCGCLRVCTGTLVHNEQSVELS